MQRLKVCFCLPFAPLFKRVRIPLIERVIPVWAIVLFVLFVLLPTGGAALVLTNQPVFCKSCHEMGLHYATWSQSAHRDVTCEECHVMPGTAAMFKSKLNALRLVREHAKGEIKTAAIQGHVPDANCKRCHPETPELVTYHGLKITHRDHWNMGVSCTYCHDRVVHGPKWLYTGVTSTEQVRNVTTPFQFAPTMEGCYRCHDGKKAPNTCSTCHVTLGERKPTAFDPAWVEAHRQEVRTHGEQDCERCHIKTFCDTCHRTADPHPSDWVARHPEQAKQDPKGCEHCHLAPAEKPPKEARDMAFCRACHGLRQEHRQADWQIIHGQESLNDPAACRRCHTASWCSDCHSISRPHPQEWLERHPAEANRNPENCKVCHTQQFCDACHESRKGIPASHAKNWLTQHQNQARAGDASCRTCHEEQFCQSCHAKKAPSSHGDLWLTQHGSASESQPQACLLCHKESYCNQCHGLTMPHPKLWLASHHRAALENRKVCDRCHRKESCDTCHRGALPESHRPGDWMNRHGAQALKSTTECLLCHRNDFCTACHGIQMPHPKDWEKSAHGAAAQKDSASCYRCHQQSDCTSCHGLTMPHPDTWVSDHGKQASADASACLKCHEPGKDCTTCHAAMPPASHQDATWTKDHPVQGATNMDLCTLCHGENACVDCHAKRGVNG
jgi:nitrate/TMAO reductase-like tetraheme cytochrome c subunit